MHLIYDHLERVLPDAEINLLCLANKVAVEKFCWGNNEVKKTNNDYTNEQLYKIHSLKGRKWKGLSLSKNFTQGKGNTVDSGY